MSRSKYKKNDYNVRTVSYEYFLGDKWAEGAHICYEKTDDLAIESCYKNAVPSKYVTFHITGIETVEY